MKRTLVFLFAASLSVVAAWYRPGDSAHAMGMVSIKGGRALHPVHLPIGKDRYTMVLTGTVLPPYQEWKAEHRRHRPWPADAKRRW